MKCIISFVINRSGTILDDRPIGEAFAQIDAGGSPPPLGYMINCAYPSFLNAADLAASSAERLIGFQANASSLDHSELEGSRLSQMDDMTDWSCRMAALNRHYGIRILGGCCGTRVAHLRHLVRELMSTAPKK